VVASVRVAEVGATNCNVVSGRSKTVYRHSRYSRGWQTIARVVTHSSAVVPRSHEDRHSFEHRLQISYLEGCIQRRAVLSFAASIAETEDRRHVALVQEVLDGDEPAKVGRSVSAGSQLKVGAWSRGAGPLGIYDGLAIISVSAGVWAAPGMHRRERPSRVGIESKRLSKRFQVVVAIDVAILDYRNCLSLARDPQRKEGVELVDR